MRPRLCAIINLCCVVALAGRIFAAGADAPQPPAVNDKFADFSLDNLQGKSVSLHELTRQGPVVLLILRGWPGYQCPICTKQVGEFVAHEKDLKDANARVLM